MKASLKLLFTLLLSSVFSITSKNSKFDQSFFLSPLKLIHDQLQINYILDINSDFDEVSKQVLTELLENSIQVVSYLVQEIPTTLSTSPSNKLFCSEFTQLDPSQMMSADIILLITSDKNSKKSLSLEDCSSTLYSQKLGLIKVNTPLLLKESDNSTIYTIVENLSKTYFENAEIHKKLYELFNSNLGASCTLTCKVCNTNTGTCTTCYDATHMKIKNGICYCTDPNAIFFTPTNSCVCKSGYYFDDKSVCVPCPTVCASCSSSQSCLSCINPNQMTLYNNWCYCSYPEGSVFNSTSKTCNCPNDTWIDGQFCQTCNATCSSCINQDTCTSCRDSENMNLIGGICSCIDPNSYFNETLGLCKCDADYYISDGTCYACESPCKTCSDNVNCDSCVDSNMTLYDGVCECPANSTFIISEGRCACDVGMFLNRDQVCESCLTECATCNDTSSCLSCIDPDFMTLEDGICECNTPAIFNITTRECDCPQGQFREDSNCAMCSSPGCSFCTNLTDCMSCFQTSNYYIPYKFVNGTCECSDPNAYSYGHFGCMCSAGYIHINQQCEACSLGCENCETVTGTGLNCPVNNLCCYNCFDPYMTINSNNVCQCPNHSYFSTKSKTCQCNGGYYGNPDGGACTPCSLPCKNCTSPTNCTSCALPNQMALLNGVCTCTSPNNSVYNSTLNQCVCSVGTYLNDTSCDNCDETCMACENQSECLSCIDPVYMILESNGTCLCLANSFFNGTACECNNDFFWDGIKCAECEPPCQRCLNQSICLSCLDPNSMILDAGECICTDPHAHFDNNENTCVCVDGYFMSNSICLPCPEACSTCQNYTYCTSCVDENNMSLINGVCICSNPTNSVFNPNLNECVCPESTYQSNASCNHCPITCISCESSTECLDCVDPIHMSFDNGICVCPENSNFTGESCNCNTHFFWIGSECAECNPPCQQCENYNYCLSCLDPDNMILSNGECTCTELHAIFDYDQNLCVCSTGYFMVNSECWNCPATCSACENITNCTSCIDENNMSLVNGSCICNDPNANFISIQQKCVCNVGYQFDDNICIECPIECSYCSPSNVCIQCANPEEMTVISGICICNENNTAYDSSTNSCICRQQYYYDGNECVACQSPMCAICENDRCLSCIDSTNMTLKSGICYCNDPYSYFNTSSGLCQCSSDSLPNLIDNTLQCIPISSSCREFSIDGICMKCADANMQLYQGKCYCIDPNASYNMKTQNCSCNLGYQLTNNDKFCQPCNSFLNGGIMGCSSCNNGKCLGCQQNMLLSDGVCFCNTGFEWDNILGSCVCAPGFWNSTDCPSCGCYSCSANGTCLEPCVENSLWINGTCSCNSGFYPCGDNQCCSLSETCDGWIGDYCDSCIGKMQIYENNTANAQCLCPGSSIYSLQLNNCVCPAGEYYYNTYTCESCGSYCNNCTSDGECISCQAPFILQNGNCTCDPNAIQSWNNCICKNGYYMGSTYICLPCPEHCETCISSAVCTSCNDNLLLVNNNCLCSDINAAYNIETGQCECAVGYYSEGSKCIACLASCYDCLDDGVTCTSCADRKNMILNEGVCNCIDPNSIFNSTSLKCECPYGYRNGVCNACGPGCADCYANRCYSCYDPTLMILVGNSCTCLDPNSYFVEWAKICTCNEGFYYNGQICAPFPGLMFNK